MKPIVKAHFNYSVYVLFRVCLNNILKPVTMQGTLEFCEGHTLGLFRIVKAIS